jgi:hypothetical protein
MPRVFVPPKKKGKNNKAEDKDILLGDPPRGFLDIDPERLRFQHSKIRSNFSGCGRSLQETLDAIRNGELSPHDIPPIQVIVGPDENDGKGPWYFALNNRRAWVLKRCREENLIKNNLIRVRYRKPKTPAEAARYSLENCAVEAKIMQKPVEIDQVSNNLESVKISDGGDTEEDVESKITKDVSGKNQQANQNEDTDSDEQSGYDYEIATEKTHKNPFALVELSDSSDDSEEE